MMVFIISQKYSTMVFRDTLLCSTDGTVNILTPTSLRNPLTGEHAILPVGASVEKIAIYRDGDNTVTSGCIIQLGVVGDTTRYITTLDGNSTSQLNSGHTISRVLTSDVGLSAATELRVTLSGTLSTGSVVFEITYITYS